MTTLARNKQRAYGIDNEEAWADLPAIAADVIYEGAACGESGTTGTYRPLVAADAFGGFADRQCDNSAGAANDRQIRVRSRGRVELIVAGVTDLTAQGDTVYASDDDTFTLTSSSAFTQIGKVLSVDDTTNNLATVYFEAAVVRSI